MIKSGKLSYTMGGIFAFIGTIFFMVGTAIFTNLGEYGEYYEDKFGSIIFLIMGSIFAIIGFSLIILARKNKKRKIRLMDEGICYDAKIVDMYYNYSVQVNGRSPLVVECSYKDNRDETYIVKSENLWLKYDPMNITDLSAKIWVDQNEKSNYFIEVISNIKYDHDFR